MSDRTTYTLSPKGNYTELGDFVLKLVAEVSGHGASEGYWLCSSKPMFINISKEGESYFFL